MIIDRVAPLETLLVNLAAFDATDPRDVIYAITCNVELDTDGQQEGPPTTAPAGDEQMPTSVASLLHKSCCRSSSHNSSESAFETSALLDSHYAFNQQNFTDSNGSSDLPSQMPGISGATFRRDKNNIPVREAAEFLVGPQVLH